MAFTSARFLARLATRSSPQFHLPASRPSPGPIGSACNSPPFSSKSSRSLPTCRKETQIRGSSFGDCSLPGKEFSVVPFWKWDSASLCGGFRAQNSVQLVPRALQHVRTIMVEVRRNDLDRAIRRWRRKWKEENLIALKEREFFVKPSKKRVLALKERDRRLGKKAFRVKLNWIMSRRQRGF